MYTSDNRSIREALSAASATWASERRMTASACKGGTSGNVRQHKRSLGFR